MKLISERIENVSFIKDKDGYYNFTGPFIQAGVINGNKRIYNYDKIFPGVNRYITEKVKTHRALGELNHPPTPEINPKEVSHMITSLSETMLDSNRGVCNWIGRAKVLDTPNGKIVQALFEAGVQLAVSTRALGSVKYLNGINEVQDDFRLCTAADIVYDPSAPDAFICGILENKEWLVDGQGLLREMFVEEYKKEVKLQSAKKTKEELFLAFRKYLSSL